MLEGVGGDSRRCSLQGRGPGCWRALEGVGPHDLGGCFVKFQGLSVNGVGRRCWCWWMFVGVGWFGGMLEGVGCHWGPLVGVTKGLWALLGAGGC